MRIDKNSRGTLALVFGFSALVSAALIIFVKIPWIVYPVVALMLWFCIWQLAFFRIPERERKGSDTIVTSVADGRVVIIEKTYEKEYLKQECIQLSVYMNFFDVHANFWPVDGSIDYYKYYPGEHFFRFQTQGFGRKRAQLCRNRDAFRAESVLQADSRWLCASHCMLRQVAH